MCLEKRYFLMLLVSILLPFRLMAADLDLSGWWESAVDDGTSNISHEKFELKQSGNKVTAKQNDPDIAALLGENQFEGELSGSVIKGKFATVIGGEKNREICGKNWANWVNFELTLSQDGNRLEGKWLQHQYIAGEPGCPKSRNDRPTWRSMTLSRTMPPVENSSSSEEIGPTNKDYLIGALTLLGAGIMSFLIRNAYVNYLVSGFKRSPNNAGLAGWGLFGSLFLGSAIGSVALVSKGFLTIPLVSSLGTLAAISFLICALVSGKK